ncbi:TadE/TadG family type IV pilus assembly protein, partial [Thermanaerothrix sp.]
MITIGKRSRTARRHRAQALVEFALALPLFLLLIFGIIEFGRFMQAWLALENGARFGVRYAVTGAYNPDYCDEADAIYGLGDEDLADGKVDCKVPARRDWNGDGRVTTEDDRMAEEMTNRLQDWARLPSIRDAALAGAMGIAAAFDDFTIAQDYLGYLSHPLTSFSTQYRGNPNRTGYFAISICSSRHYDGGQPQFGFLTAERLDPQYHSYLPVCIEMDENGNIIRYMDDPGGPGDRVRVTLTYRHALITPLPNIAALWTPGANGWWDGLLVSAQREGIVEKFRVSRVTGLAGAIGMAATFTPTPSETPTATSTLT